MTKREKMAMIEKTAKVLNEKFFNSSIGISKIKFDNPSNIIKNLGYYRDFHNIPTDQLMDMVWGIL